MKHCANKSNLAIVRDYLNGERPFIQVGYRAEDKYIIRKEGEEWTDINGKQWKETKTGELTGYIPPELQMEANKHGLLIECALYREGKYVMRILPSYDSPRQSGPC